MTATRTTPDTAPAPSVSRRELRILIGISLGTMIVMALLAEVGARVVFPREENNSCYRPDRLRPIAGCQATIKGAEAPWTPMAFNDCGYRSAQPCGPRPPGTRRIVVMGKSVSVGLYVRYEDFFAARVERALSAACGFPVESQSLGSLGITADRQADLLPEVLRLAPDVVVLPLEAFDMTYFADGSFDDRPPHPPVEVVDPGKVVRPHYNLVTQLRLLSRESRALLIAQHFLLMNEDFLLRAYTLGHEEDTLHTPLSEAYQRRYARLETVLRNLSTQLGARGVPLVVIALPNRIQAAMISHHLTVPGTDPYAFSRELQAVGARAGVRVVDTFERIAAQPHGERLFYAVDGHPTGEAHAIVADLLERSLVDGSVPAFRGCQLPD